MSQENIMLDGTKCPVCCTGIQIDDEIIICPDCHMPHHKDCWHENHGCATYGCRSSGCLKPVPMKIDVNADGAASNLPSGISICSKCHTQLGAGTAFCWQCGTELGGRAIINFDAPLAGAWIRWTARILDYTLELIFAEFFIGMIWDISKMGDAVADIVFCPFVFCIDSAVYGICGNTLGKWLFGIKVVNLVGHVISGKEYFMRNWRVYWAGFGFAIPGVSLYTSVVQYSRVSKGNPATYDEIVNLRSIRQKSNALKSFLGVMLLVIIFIGLIVLRTSDK